MDFHLEQRDVPFVAYLGHGLMNMPHLHKHIEIVLLEKGKTLAVADSKEAFLESGDLFISFPNQIHYYIDESPDTEHKIIIISPDICPEFSREFKNLLPVSPLLKSARANTRIVFSIENLLACHDSQSKYAEIEIKGNMLLLLSELFKVMPLEKKQTYDANLLTNIIQYCYDNYTENITLQTLAKTHHVSHFYISHIFSERLHINFRDYINTLRIEKARELIKMNKNNITEIAYEVGYNSVRTFDRCFAKIEGISPKEYREKMLNKK